MDFLNPLFDAIGWLLALFYSAVPNFGVSIILLTFTIMLILYPLTAKQAKSMIAMQRVQPEIKKLQAKYKGDRQKLNEEMMKFYQENKINPLAGCLPLVVQLPIFFALFRVLRNSQDYVPKSSHLYSSLCQGFGVKLPNGTWSKCGADLTASMKTAHPIKYAGIEVGNTIIHHLKFLGMDLQLSATDAHKDALAAAPYFILVGLVILTGFLQTRQAQKRTPVANKQMGAVMRVLPVFFGLISLSFPSGLVLYFFVSNLWRLGQQEVIFRQHGSALHPPKKERLEGATAAGVIDAKSRVVDDEDIEDAEVVEDEAPKPILPAKKPSKAAGGGAGTPAPTAPSGKSPGGLRGLFQLPPPPESNGGGSGSSGARAPSSGSGSAGGTARPPQQRTRRKKKRKR
jgi:YidC/Oxa1 family membrane protein insertase